MKPMLTALGMALVPCKDCGAVTGALQCAGCWQAERRLLAGQKLGRSAQVIDRLVARLADSELGPGEVRERVYAAGQITGISIDWRVPGIL